jgi:hypothetical protein
MCRTGLKQFPGVKRSILGNVVSKADGLRPSYFCASPTKTYGFSSLAGRLEWHKNCPNLKVLQEAASGKERAVAAPDCFARSTRGISNAFWNSAQGICVLANGS